MNLAVNNSSQQDFPDAGAVTQTAQTAPQNGLRDRPVGPQTTQTPLENLPGEVVDQHTTVEPRPSTGPLGGLGSSRPRLTFHTPTELRAELAAKKAADPEGYAREKAEAKAELAAEMARANAEDDAAERAGAADEWERFTAEIHAVWERQHTAVQNGYHWGLTDAEISGQLGYPGDPGAVSPAKVKHIRKMFGLPDLTDAQRAERRHQALAEQAHQAKLDEEVDRVRIRRQAQRIIAREESDEKLNLPPASAGGTLAELLAVPEAEVTTERIAGLQQRGHRANLNAQFKVGKSTLSAHLAKSLVDGTPFLGAFDVEPLTGRVGIWNMEMGARDQVSYLAATGVQRADRIQVLNMRGYGIDLMTDAGRDAAVKWLQDHEVEYWILDPWQEVCARAGVDYENNTEIAPLLQAIDEVMQRAGVGEILIVHHVGWEGSRPKGATRLPEWADALWKYVRNDEDGIRMLSAEGRGIALKPGAVLLDPDTHALTFTGASRSATRFEQDVEHVVAIVAEHPGSSRNAIYPQLERSKAAAQAAVDEALNRGLILNETPNAQGSKLVVNPNPPAPIPTPAI
jgi:hypothetical protein